MDGPLAGATPKVADFGLARAMDADGSLTATGLTMGTPEYMAPEQAAGAEAGPAADIYALGAILSRLLTGHPPFRGDTPMEVLQALASATGKRLVFYCAFGERSAMAVQAAQEAGLASACHLQGGLDAWKKAEGPLIRCHKVAARE